MREHKKYGVCVCGSLVISSTTGGYAHDQTLAELKVTSEEYQRVMDNAERNKHKAVQHHHFDSLHQPQVMGGGRVRLTP